MKKKIILIILVFTLIVLTVFLAIWLLKNQSSPLQRVLRLDCESNPNPIFTHDITDLEKIDFIVPPGTVEEWEGGKVLKTHSYLRGPNKVPIYTPIDSKLYQGIYVTEGGINQYALFFEVSCEIFYLFDHLVDPVEKIKNAFPNTPESSTQNMIELGEKIDFKAGELVGYSIGEKFEQWDFGVYDKNRQNSFDDPNIPKLYQRDRWADCPFDYFPEEKRQEYYSLFKSHLNEPVPTLFCNRE